MTDELDDYEAEVERDEAAVGELAAEQDVSDADELLDLESEPDDTPFDEMRHQYTGVTGGDEDVDVEELAEAGALLDDPSLTARADERSD
ncbi:hypothetical protein BH24ACT5_BH24ACT5_05930 [soil metagenome]